MFDRFLDLEEEPYSKEDAEWDAFVAQHPQGSLLQTNSWARLKSRFGWRSHRVWLKHDSRLVAGAQVLFRSAALGFIRIAYIPHGPLVDWDNEEQLEVFFNQLDHAIYEQRAGMVKIEPLLWQNEISPDHWIDLCRRHNCLPNSDTIQPPQTMILDLQAEEDDLLAAMKQKTRYNIRLAAKKGVTVREGSLEDIGIFSKMVQVTGQRNTFGVHEPRYYQTAYELFQPNNVVLLLAEYESRPLSAIMVFRWGKKAAYLYGASSDEERKRMPNYALQWAAIQWAKERGCTEYDLWGVPDYPLEQLEAEFMSRHEGLWGVYRFKRGFGGQLRRTVGTADRIYNKNVYRLYQWQRSRGS